MDARKLAALANIAEPTRRQSDHAGGPWPLGGVDAPNATRVGHPEGVGCTPPTLGPGPATGHLKPRAHTAKPLDGAWLGGLHGHPHDHGRRLKPWQATACLWAAVACMGSAIGATFPVGHTVLVGPMQWDAHVVTVGQVKVFFPTRDYQ